MSRQRNPGDMVPALAFGEGVTLLGTIRGLAAAAIPVYVGTDPGNFTRRSRHYAHIPGPSLRTAAAGDLAEDLARLPFERAVLIPCSDSAAVAVAGLSTALKERFPASCPAADVQALLADKLRFAKTLQRLGVPHPETIEITSREVIGAKSEDDLTRFFLKPVDSERFSKTYGVKACLPRDKADALNIFDRLNGDGHAVVLQEYIGGSATRHYFIDGFVDRQGRVRARFARQRLRMFPASIGNSSCLVSIPMAEMAAASASLDRLLADLQFRGIFSAEFKRDPRDEMDKLIEVNARPWWYIGFAHACGVNVAAMAYRDALDLDVAEVAGYSTGRHCVYPVMDFKAAWPELRAGRLQLWDLASSWFNRVDPITSWRDPGPGLSEFFRLIPHMTRKLISPEKS